MNRFVLGLGVLVVALAFLSPSVAASDWRFSFNIGYFPAYNYPAYVYYPVPVFVPVYPIYAPVVYAYPVYTYYAYPSYIVYN